MNTKFVRRAALALLISGCALTTSVSAGQPYSAPSRWNNFRPALDEALAAEAAAEGLAQATEDLPAPAHAGSGTRGLNGPANSEANAPSNTSSAAPSSMGSATRNETSHHEGSGTHHHDHGSASRGSDHHHPHSVAPHYPEAIPSTPAPAPHVGSVVPAPGAYQQALSSPWGGSTFAGPSCESCEEGFDVRNELFPYFAHGEVLFLTLENEANFQIADTALQSAATIPTQSISAGQVAPQSSVGFEVGFGRYLKDGQYGIGVSYFLWNPENETAFLQRDFTSPEVIRSTRSIFRDAWLNGETNFETSVRDFIVGGTNIVSGNNAVDIRNLEGAASVIASRNLRFQGIEGNLYSFGLLGGRRASYLGKGHGHGRSCKGLTGAVGPLVRACSGRVRATSSHGFRWFQVDDEFQQVFNFGDPAQTQVPAGQNIIQSVQVENNLFGYQFGGNLNICLSSRWDLNIGGKFGLYGNNVDFRHFLGTQSESAFVSDDDPQGTQLTFDESETSVATLGELNLGVGYRIVNGWTVRGGYRLFGISGVVDAVEASNRDFSTIENARRLVANDSFVFHGGYVGMEYNW